MNDPGRVTVPRGRAERGERVVGLVLAAQAGQDEAIGQLVAEFSPLLWQVARATGLSAADAEDVMQTVWVRLLTHLDGLQAPAALTNWLVITTRREAWRVRSAGDRRVAVGEDWFGMRPDPQPGPEGLVLAAERDRELWAAFRQLPARCQELLRIVSFVPRPDYDSIAAELGMSRGSVGPTRGRCLDKLRALLTGAAKGVSR